MRRPSLSQPRRIATMALGTACLLGALTAGAAVHDVSLLQDTWVDEEFPTATHGADAELHALNEGGKRRRVLLQFDLSAIPNGAVVQAATLELTVTAEDNNGLPIVGYRMTQSWDAATSNWNDVVAGFDAATEVASFLPDPKGTVSTDLSALVQQWVDGGAPNFGLTLEAMSDAKHSSFAAREYNPGSLAATLLVITAPTETVRDAFDSESWINSDGTLPWSGAWQEINDDGNPTGGDVRVERFDPGQRQGLRIKNKDNGALRFADLSGFANGQLDLKLQRESLRDAADVLTIEATNNGGGSWVELGRITGPADDSDLISLSYDLSDHLTAGFGIRLLSYNFGAGQKIFFDDVLISVEPNADLAIQKAVDDVSPNEGQTVTYTVTVINNGPGHATGIQVDDLLPSGLSYTGHSTSAGGYLPGSGVWSLPEMAPGASETLQLSASVDPGTYGATITNTASISASDQPDPNSANDAASADLTVESADLALSQSIDDPTPNVDDVVRFTVHIANAGPDDATGIVVDDVLASGLSYETHSSDGGIFDPVLGRWNIASLAAGSGLDLRLDARLDAGTAGQVLSNTASIASVDQGDPDSGNDSSAESVTVTSVDLGVAVFVDDPAPNVGDLVTFSISLSNAGPDTATSIEVSDPLPAGISFVSATPSSGSYDDPSGVWSLAELADGATALLQLRGSVDSGTAGTTIENIASVTASDQEDPNPPNDSSAASLTVQAADLRVDKSVDDPTPNEGDSIRYTITVQNDGPDPATNVALSDTLQSGVSYAGSSADQGSYAPATHRWTVGDLPVGGTATLLLDATVDTGTGGMTIRNVAQVESLDQEDPDPADDQSGADIGSSSADLALAMVLDDPDPSLGQTITYTITLLNNGPDDATGVVVRDQLPLTLLFAGATPSAGNYDELTGLWNVGAIAAGNSETLDLSGVVLLGALGNLIDNDATITASDQPDPNGGNNSASANMAALLSDLGVTVSAVPQNPSEGDTVTVSVQLTNSGPDDADGVIVEDLLPTGLAYEDYTASQGSYAPATGEWTVGTITDGAVLTLELRGVIEPGTAGSTLTNTAEITASSEADLNAFNDSDSVDIDVQLVDVQLSMNASTTSPNVGDTVRLDVSVYNDGPDPATELQLQTSLPSGLTLQGHVAGRGTFDQGSGLWSVGNLAVDESVLLQLDASVDPGTGGSDLLSQAQLAAVHETDADAANDSASAVLSVQSADLWLALIVDNPMPREGEGFVYSLSVGNLGPDAASAVVVEDILPSGLLFVGSTPSQGSYDDGTGLWQIGSLAVGTTVTLDLSVQADFGAGGSVLSNVATIVARDQEDPQPGNDSDSVDVDIIERSRIAVEISAQSATDLLPGDAPVAVYELELRNDGRRTETLNELSLANSSSGLGTQQQLDESWSTLQLVCTLLGAPEIPLPAPTQSFSAGSADFTGLSMDIPAGETLRISVMAGASLTARDGDTLDLRIDDPSSLVFDREVLILPTGSLDPAGGFPVDGMSAAQVATGTSPKGPFLTGSSRNLAFEFIVPANGYEADTLSRLNVTNLGTASDQIHLTGMEAFADDGDGSFDPASDPLLGQLSHTGDRWELTGLGLGVPFGGQKIFVTVDIAADVAPSEPSLDGKTVQLALPSSGDLALLMLSANDGPRDVPVVHPDAQTISPADKISLTTAPITAGSVRPGSDDIPLLSVQASNTYSTVETLNAITFGNNTVGTGSQAQLDAELELVSLRFDGDADGVLDEPAIDPVLGNTLFVDGRASFEGLAWDLAPLGSSRFFLAGRVATGGAADQDVLGARVENVQDVRFSRPVAINASWPLDSGAAWTIDGMVAAQAVLTPTPSPTLGPDEGPALALDLQLPANGYRSDVLEGITVENRGSAQDSDLGEIRLWRDGGDGLFSAGVGGDDVDLGPLVALDGVWTSALLSQPVPTTGVRLFLGVTVGSSPTDSSTVRFAVPVDGVTFESENDGPIDAAIESGSTLLFSSAPLLAELAIQPGASTVGQNVTVRMDVRNLSDETITNIQPSALAPSGDATLDPVDGPNPVTFDLAQGESSSFTWTFQASGAGQVQLSADAQGIGDTSGLSRLSLSASSGIHRVFVEVDSLGLVPVPASPFSVNRGQANVVPLSLTFDNRGDTGGSDVLLRGFQVRLEDDAQQGIVPDQLLASVTVNEGTITYLNRGTLESSGDLVDLTLATPVRITPSEPVSVSLQLEILESTVVDAFRVAIVDASWFTAEDATSGAPVAIAIEGGPSAYPILSGLATVRASATQLDVDGWARDTRRVVQGQTDVELLGLDLVNPGIDGLTDNVRVGQLAISVTDTLGQILTDAGRFLDRLRVVGPEATHAEWFVPASHDSTVSLTLNPPLDIAVNPPLTIRLTGDLRTDAELGAFRVELRGEGIEAWDASTGDDVPAVLSSDPLPGGARIVEIPVDTAFVLGTPRMPTSVLLGETDVPILEATVRHPGPSGAAQLRLDGLSVRAHDQSRQALTIGDQLRRLRVLWNGSEVADMASMPPSGSIVAIPLPQLLLASAETGTLSIRGDIELAATADYLELSIRDEDLTVVDANTSQPVDVQPDGSGELPLVSGLARLTSPAQELRVATTSSMPAVAVPGGEGMEAMRLRLSNPAESDGGEIHLHQLRLRGARADFTSLAVGEFATQLAVSLADSTLASASLSPDSTTATLVLADDLAVGPGQTVELEISVSLRSDATVRTFRVGFDEPDVGVVQPNSSLFTIRVEPDGGSFPFYSEAANLTVASLEGSFSNYPNPFAAGREETHIPFFLPAASQVSLEVYTLDGYRVIRLLSAERLPAGLHDSLSWDGRNEDGDVVRNGVYLLRLKVDGPQGADLLRKVAVLR